MGLTTGSSSRLANYRKANGLDVHGLTKGGGGAVTIAEAGNGGGGRVPAPPPPAATRPSSSASQPRPKPVPVQDRIAATAAAATAAVKARFDAVLASPGAAGRHRVAAVLLSSPKNFSTAAIISQLPHLQTDADLAAQDAAAAKIAAADAVWARAYGLPEAKADLAQAGGAIDPKMAASDRVWNRAYASSHQQPAAAPAGSSRTAVRTSDDVWARAYGSVAE